MAAAGDAYAEHLFAGGKSVATVATDLGAVRWWATAAGIEGAAWLGADGIAPAGDGEPPPPGTGPGGGRRLGRRRLDRPARRCGRDAEGTAGRRVDRHRLRSVRPRVGSRRATGPGSRTGQRRDRHGRSLAGQDRPRPDRLSAGLDRPETRRMARGRRDRCRRRAPVPGPRPLGPDQGRGPGHAAARRGRRGAPARRRHRTAGHRPLAPGRGRRLDGQPRGQPRSHCSRPGDGPHRTCPPTTDGKPAPGPVPSPRSAPKTAGLDGSDARTPPALAVRSTGGGPFPPRLLAGLSRRASPPNSTRSSGCAGLRSRPSASLRCRPAVSLDAPPR